MSSVFLSPKNVTFKLIVAFCLRKWRFWSHPLMLVAREIARYPADELVQLLFSSYQLICLLFPSQSSSVKALLLFFFIEKSSHANHWRWIFPSHDRFCYWHVLLHYPYRVLIYTYNRAPSWPSFPEVPWRGCPWDPVFPGELVGFGSHPTIDTAVDCRIRSCEASYAHIPSYRLRSGHHLRCHATVEASTDWALGVCSRCWTGWCRICCKGKQRTIILYCIVSLKTHVLFELRNSTGLQSWAKFHGFAYCWIMPLRSPFFPYTASTKFLR